MFGRVAVQLTVVVENQTSSQKLLAEWGWCVWLQDADRAVMLDTGGIQHTLTRNLEVLGLDACRVGDIVLSHGHFDHTSGLIDMLRLAPHARLWAAPTVGRERLGDAQGVRCSGGGALLAGLPIQKVDPVCQVTPEITAFTVPVAERDPRWLTPGRLFERDACGAIVPDTFEDDLSLLVKTPRGASLVLGCAHAGLSNILDYAVRTFGVDAFDTVIGGTHLGSVAGEDLPAWMEKLSEFSVRRWRPAHCTGFRAAAALSRYFSDVDWAPAGTVLEL